MAENERFSMMEFGERDIEDPCAIDRVLSRIDAIAKYLGSKALEKFRKYAGMKRHLEHRFEEFREKERLCNKGGPKPHSHGYCIEQAIEDRGMLGKWPDLTINQSRMIFERKLFIGMTKDQAEAALGFLLRSTGHMTADGYEQNIWRANWHPEHAPEPKDWVRLIFVGNSLVGIETARPIQYD